MATLEKIRSKAGCLVIAIGFALLAFLAGDLINGGSTLLRARQMNAFSVNKESVQIQDYNSLVERQEEQYRGQGMNLTQAQTVQLRNQIFTSMVAEKILKSEAAKIGLTVTPEETYDLIQGEHISPVILFNPMFSNPETGTFDKAGLLNFLKVINDKSTAHSPEEAAQIEQLRKIWLDTEKNVRNQSLSDKYTNLLTKAVVANSLEVAHVAKANKSVANLAYVTQSAYSVADSLVSVSDAVVKAYYDARKKYLRTDAGAVLDVIYTNITPSDADYQAAQEDAEAAHKELAEGADPARVLEEYSDIPYTDLYMPLADLQRSQLPQQVLEFVTTAGVGTVSDVLTEGDAYIVAKLMGKKNAPESLHVKHIVLAKAGSYEGQTNADSLLQVLKGDASLFAAAAAEHSLDRNSSKSGGELGWLTEASATQYIGADFAKAIYSAQIGVPFAFTSKYGEHLVLVEEAKPSVEKYNVALSLSQVKPSTETHTKIYNDLSHFLANNKGAGIDTAAITAGYQILDDLRVQSSQPVLANNLPESREVVRWAMNNAKGEISSIIEAGDKYIIARVVDKFEEGTIPMEAVRNELTAAVRAEAKVNYLYDQLKTGNYSTLDAYATVVNAPIDTLNYVKYSTPSLESIGAQPAVNAVATIAPIGQVTPVKGINAVFLISVLERTEDATDTTTEETVRAELTNGRRGMIRNSVLQQLTQTADIKDYRWKFY